MNCQNCDHPLPPRAAFCPACDAPVDDPVDRGLFGRLRAGLAPNPPTLFLVLLGGFLLYGVLGRGVGSPSPGPATSATLPVMSSRAWFACQEFVKQRLQAPATASFPWIGEPDVTIDTFVNNRWHVHAYVEAENDAGDQGSATFDCTVQYRGASAGHTPWTLESLRIQPEGSGTASPRVGQARPG